jgi:hypothetical protein
LFRTTQRLFVAIDFGARSARLLGVASTRRKEFVRESGVGGETPTRVEPQDSRNQVDQLQLGRLVVALRLVRLTLEFFRRRIAVLKEQQQTKKIKTSKNNTNMPRQTHSSIRRRRHNEERKKKNKR